MVAEPSDNWGEPPARKRSKKQDAYGRALTPAEKEKRIASLEKDMKKAAAALDFERAVVLRDEIARIREGET